MSEIKLTALAALGCDPPKADVATQNRKTFDLRSNTAEGDCAT